MTNFVTAFKAFFTKTSVDSILATFTKKVKELEDHAAAKYKESTVYSDLADKYFLLRKDAVDEVFKAKKAAEKLKGFFD